jgi:hypothetical protein
VPEPHQDLPVEPLPSQAACRPAHLWYHSLSPDFLELSYNSPWIEDIMSKATDNFKNDPYVKDYYKKAQENQEIMNGTRDAQGGMQPEMEAAPQVNPDAAPAPTANELAAPTIPEKQEGQE